MSNVIQISEHPLYYERLESAESRPGDSLRVSADIIPLPVRHSIGHTALAANREEDNFLHRIDRHLDEIDVESYSQAFDERFGEIYMTVAYAGHEHEYDRILYESKEIADAGSVQDGLDWAFNEFNKLLAPQDNPDDY